LANFTFNTPSNECWHFTSKPQNVYYLTNVSKMIRWYHFR